MTDVAPLTVVEVLTIAVCSGACGGVIAVGTQLTISQREIYIFCKGGRPPLANIANARYKHRDGDGFGSWIAVRFTFLQLLHQDRTMDNVLFLISGCLIAGIAAQRLIPTLTDSLTRQLKLLEHETEQAHEAADEAFLVTQATAMLAPNVPKTDKFKVLTKLRQQLSKTPLDRTLTLLTGRLYRRLNDLRSAISVLDDFIKNKEAVGEIDKDVADALYNMACYYALEWDSNKTAGMRTNSFDALRRSIQISPENKRDAAEDPDFGCFRQEQEFLDIVN